MENNYVFYLFFFFLFFYCPQVHVSNTARTHQSSAVKRRKDAESRLLVVQEQLESVRITNERLLSSHRSSSEQEELVLRLEEDKTKLEVRI